MTITLCSVSLRWDLIECGSGTRDFGEDVFRFLGPNECFRVGVVMCNVVADCVFQFGHAPEHAVADAVLGDVAEPTLDHVQPRAAGGRAVDVKSPVTFQPLHDVGMLVRGVVIDDQMQIQVRWRLGVDLLPEPDPFLMAVLWQALGNDPALRQFDCGKQRRRAFAFVIVRQCLQSAGEQGETLLCPIEGLNRARLITRQHQRVLGRVEVQTHDIDELFDEPGIVRDLERFHAMRLQPVVAPDALHRGLADSRRLGHHSHRPVRGVGRSLPSGLGDHVRLFRDPDRRCPTTARGILFDPRQPIRSKPVPPSSDRPPRASEIGRNLIVPPANRSSENDLGPQTPVAPAYSARTPLSSSTLVLPPSL